MRYYEQDDRRGRVWGIIGVVLYIVLCVGVMFITHTIVLPAPEAGILVDFGTSDTGFGEDDPASGDVDVSPATPEPQPAPDDPVMTVDDPEAPPVAVEDRPVTPVAATPTEDTPVREVDRRALFPGRTEGSDATSQGTAGGEGNQGTQDGAPGGSDTAGGSGVDGFSLMGRKGVGEWPAPAYNVEVEGRVVIRVNVDREGKVTSATYEAKGSNINDSRLVNAARDAARHARFTESDVPVQTGTITYFFRLKR